MKYQIEQVTPKSWHSSYYRVMAIHEQHEGGWAVATPMLVTESLKLAQSFCEGFAKGIDVESVEIYPKEPKA